MAGKVSGGSVLDWEEDPFTVLTIPSMTPGERLHSVMLLADMVARMSGRAGPMSVTDRRVGDSGCSLLFPPSSSGLSRMPEMVARRGGSGGLPGAVLRMSDRFDVHARLWMWLRNSLGKSAEAGVDQVAAAAGTKSFWSDEHRTGTWREAPLPAGGDGSFFARSPALWGEFERLCELGLVGVGAAGATRAAAEALFLSEASRVGEPRAAQVRQAPSV